MKPSTLKLDFDQLFTLKQFADNLRLRQVASLASFGDAKSFGFKHRTTAPDKDDVSMSSTATSIVALIDCGLWKPSSDNDGWKNFKFLTGRPFWANRETHYVETLLSQEWTSAGLAPDNAFTVAFVVEACAHLLLQMAPGTLPQKTVQKVLKTYEHNPPTIEPFTLDALLTKAVRILEDVLFNRSAAAGENEARPGCVSVLGYPPNAYLTMLAARALDKMRQVDKDRVVQNDMSLVGKWAMDEISSQIALIKSGSNLGDPLILAYAVICAARYRPSQTRTPTENELIRFALRTFFDSQKDSGGWPQSQPLFHYPTSGSAYCYDYELLAELLATKELYDLFYEYIPNIERATLALDTTKFDLGDGVYGWASNQRMTSTGPESWATACVYLFLHRLDRFIAEAIRQTIAEELETTYTGVRAAAAEGPFAQKFIDCPFSATDSQRSLRDEIKRRLVDPLVAGRDALNSGQRLPKTVMVSAILFGPPGTSKTEIVEQIASYVGWPAVTVDPSYFVKNGLDAIQAQANRIFRMLASSEQLVVLFDEFDEMVRNRDKSDELLSRFLTTAMLPKLAKINKERRILFIVATNYIQNFDIAISRPGRFDLVFQMMPPKAADKLVFPRWSKDLTWLKECVGEGFDADLAKLTYLETDKLVSKLTKDLGEDLDGRSKEIACDDWRKALTNCTLARPNEQSLRESASKQGEGPSDGADGEKAAKHLTWGEVAVEEARYIRED